MSEDSILVPDPSLATLRGYFGESARSKGLAYARQGRVSVVSIEDDENASQGWTVDAEAEGTAPEPYSLSLDLARDEAGRWHWSGDCSCPVGWRCKHQFGLLVLLSQVRPDIVPPVAVAQPPVFSREPEPGARALRRSGEDDSSQEAATGRRGLRRSTPADEASRLADREQMLRELVAQSHKLKELLSSQPKVADAAENASGNPTGSPAGTASGEAAKQGVRSVWQSAAASLVPVQPAAQPAPRPDPHVQQAQRWLNALEQRASPPEARAGFGATARRAPSEDCVRLEIVAQAQRANLPAVLFLQPVRARILKKTGLPGAPSKLGDYEVENLAHDAEQPPVLREALLNLLAMRHLSPQRWATPQLGGLHGSLALPTLQAAVQAGFVGQRDEDGRLSVVCSWGPALRLDWRWRSEERPGAETLWHLDPLLRDESGQAVTGLFFAGPPPLYWQEAQATVGPLDLADTSPALLAEWQRLPPLPQAWLQEKAQALLPRLPGLPEELNLPAVRRVYGTAPVPVLRLDRRSQQVAEITGQAGPAGKNNPSGRKPAGHVAESKAARSSLLPMTTPDQDEFVWQAELSFDYDGCRLPARVWSVTALESGLERVPLSANSAAIPAWVEVWRQPKREQQWQELWQAQWADDEGDPRRRLAAWLAEDFATIKAQGFQVELGEALVPLEVSEVEAGLEPSPTQTGWMDLRLQFRLQGQPLDLQPLLPQLLAGLPTLPPGADPKALELPDWLWAENRDGRWLRLPSDPLRPWLSLLVELLAEKTGDGPLRLSPVELLRLGAEQISWGQDGPQALRDVLAARQIGSLPRPLPEGWRAALNADLRPYQQHGLAWLQALARYQLGGILADDMGLGKTLMTLAHLLAMKLAQKEGTGSQEGLSAGPCLVLMPTSLMGNWQREARRFTPSLRVLALQGPERHGPLRGLLRDPSSFDLVLSTYALLPRDIEQLVKIKWQALVLDEAQALKNPGTQTAQAARRLQSPHRLALTGTPMENHLGELWSLMDLVLPGYLGRHDRFQQLYRQPIERPTAQQPPGLAAQRMALLRRRLMPFMLRRDKRMVAAELPPKVEQVVRIRLGEEQANFYETIRAAAETKVQSALAAKGLARSHIAVLEALLKLRQACCDPRLVKLPANASAISAQAPSAKLEWLQEQLPQMLEEGRRILVFSQFTSLLALLQAELERAGQAYALLTGDSRPVEREAAILRFTEGQVPLFLISLKAGGVGLNLPQADTVIHLDPWWNPAVEEQATDRAHRLGQVQTVFVYKLVAEGTVEERILAMQARKAALAAQVQASAQAAPVSPLLAQEAGADAESDEAHTAIVTAPALSEADLSWLLKPLGSATLEAGEGD